MLQQVHSRHFQPLLGQTGSLTLPDGSCLPVRFETLEESPRAKMPNTARMPFSVEFNSLEGTEFVDGLCALEVPELGKIEGVFVSRIPPMGRDPTLGYFYIAFN
ncbi:MULTISPECIES: DUF6916 family protein [unclassified Pseudomonas]|jgi:hypothetical protein|uniref:DUF6916 family protein n=1 Tax=unclassified Pseudomonas TaxID=196821 RepID=UPI0020336186|nr:MULTISPECIES: hypothetical protein [unclassified Pseudomonas]MCM2462483.1 hypothetical protein [Pseudomonas sp. CG7]WLG95636.1 hypothetical protein PSH78_25440 [Pseudomonas sp. FP198]